MEVGMVGFSVNNTILNLLLGICMLLARVLPILATLKLAENLASKKLVAESNGTLDTTSNLFVIVTIIVIIVIGGLSFLPSIVLGPIAQLVS